MSLPPQHLLDIKKEISTSYPDFAARATKAWGEILEEMARSTDAIVKDGTSRIPQIDFSELDTLSREKIEEIKRRGTVAIKNIVDDEEALQWKAMLDEFIKANPDVTGVPEGNKQFFQLYWTKSQLKARSHPNMLKTQQFLNQLFHAKPGTNLEGVDLSTPLTYADRFRIRHPGGEWPNFPPHVDGGSIERWEDPTFRQSFEAILSGEWKKHDPFDLTGRLDARTSLYKRPNQSTVFRSFQGWLAMSETAPTEGTLKVFPDVFLSNVYMILRPFFRPTVSSDSAEILKPSSWEFSIDEPEFPGIFQQDGGYAGPRLSRVGFEPMRLNETMISVPKVSPGDAVFWHCDVVHSVEVEHTGKGDSAVMYIPAVPSTPQNRAYIEKQKECFLKGEQPPDYPKFSSEANFTGIGTSADVFEGLGRAAMGLPISVA